MIVELIHALKEAEKDPGAERHVLSLIGDLRSMNQEQYPGLIRELLTFAQASNSDRWASLISLVLSGLPLESKQWVPDDSVEALVQLYQTCPDDSILRSHLLCLIGSSNRDNAQKTWVDLLCNSPPQNNENIQLAFAPFIDHQDRFIDERLLQILIDRATHHLTIAASIYELCNHEFRKGRNRPHLLQARSRDLVELLGNLIFQLGRIEEGHLPPETNPQEIASIVQNSVALIIALIDAVSLLQEEQAIGKLYQAIELKHRRIQVEAAAGLARIGEESGQDKLVDLAQHPVVRPRVIAYARELGFENKISLEFQGPIAEAESSLALWLGSPQQMGLAPTSIELVDERTLYWPSYEDPIHCFLFQFEYGAGDQAFKNIGINGPLTHAFTSDIRHLSAVDQYSAFAGWQTMSDEIYTIPIDRAERLIPNDFMRLRNNLDAEDLDSFELQTIASFFGEYAMVVSASKEEQPGTMIVDINQSEWIPEGNSQSAIDWTLAFDIWKGRKLLTNFNPAFS
ncbi:MAG: HEAT repeat domain-containing protein [Planctomycetota bacterium]